MKYKIEFYSPLLNRRVVKVVERPCEYQDAIILQVIKPMPKINFFGLGKRGDLWD